MILTFLLLIVSCCLSCCYSFLYNNEELVLMNLNTTSCSSAPACGKTMASYNGVDAYSNGPDQCTGNSCGGYTSTGYAYQCVELAQRYMHIKHGITSIWYDNANQMCDNFPSGIKKTSNPAAGDLFVRTSGTYGHVAVITSVGSSTVDVIEQNSSPTGTNTYSKSDAGCFLTASSSSGSCHTTGYYCGNDNLGLSANSLYYCSGSGATPTLHTSCSTTCVTMPSGQDDKCDSSSSSCSSITASAGYYCGDDKINGNSNTLYYCLNSKLDGAVYCSSGCVTAQSGSDDYCK